MAAVNVPNSQRYGALRFDGSKLRILKRKPDRLGKVLLVRGFIIYYLQLCDISPYGTIWPCLLRDTSANWHSSLSCPQVPESRTGMLSIRPQAPLLAGLAKLSRCNRASPENQNPLKYAESLYCQFAGTDKAHYTRLNQPFTEATRQLTRAPTKLSINASNSLGSPAWIQGSMGKAMVFCIAATLNS